MNSIEDLKAPTITPASDRSIMIRFSTKISEYVHEQVSYFHNILSKKGLILSGLSPDGKLAETIEIKEHPWFVACQFHPEFKSKPFQPHPLFVNFIKASSKKS